MKASTQNVFKRYSYSFLLIAGKGLVKTTRGGVTLILQCLPLKLS